jgi:hypothetical protein
VLPVVPAPPRSVAEYASADGEQAAAGRERVFERFLTTRELEDHLRLMGRLA